MKAKPFPYAPRSNDPMILAKPSVDRKWIHWGEPGYKEALYELGMVHPELTRRERRKRNKRKNRK